MPNEYGLPNETAPGVFPGHCSDLQFVTCDSSEFRPSFWPLSLHALRRSSRPVRRNANVCSIDCFVKLKKKCNWRNERDPMIFTLSCSFGITKRSSSNLESNLESSSKAMWKMHMSIFWSSIKCPGKDAEETSMLICRDCFEIFSNLTNATSNEVPTNDW